jgi:site-specific recombinase XerD
MAEREKLGPWVRRFLLEYLVRDRNLARSTQQSYRDTLVHIIKFAVQRIGSSVDQLRLVDLSADLLRTFLIDLEQMRRCKVTTRNQRLAAVHAFAHFVGMHSPEHIEWCGQVRGVPFKKTAREPAVYLRKAEMNALLETPNVRTEQGNRDYALLLFLYNSGARADEAAQLKIADIHLAQAPDRDYSSVRIRGKGGKLRVCPLWPNTVREIVPLISGRAADEHVFINRCHRPITRFGIHQLVKRYARKAAGSISSVAHQRVGPHTIRHSTAMHLLQSGVDINTIRAWLGHISIDTTSIYADADLEMKAKALAHCEVKAPSSGRHWREEKDLLDFLRSL